MRRNQFDGGWQSLLTILRQEHSAIFVATQILAQVEFSIDGLALPLFPGLRHLGLSRFTHVKFAHYIGVSAQGLPDPRGACLVPRYHFLSMTRIRMWVMSLAAALALMAEVHTVPPPGVPVPDADRAALASELA